MPAELLTMCLQNVRGAGDFLGRVLFAGGGAGAERGAATADRDAGPPAVPAPHTHHQVRVFNLSETIQVTALYNLSNISLKPHTKMPPPRTTAKLKLTEPLLKTRSNTCHAEQSL